MPPKKAKGKGKGKKKKDDVELMLEDKCKRTMEEVDALKDQLVVRKELNRRAQFAMEEYKSKAKDKEEELNIQTIDQRMANANMTRQYKSMQSEMTVKITNLERELMLTQQKLATVENELKVTNEIKDALTREKDQKMESLEQKLMHMERAFENLIHESLDNLLANILKVRSAWETRSTSIQSVNKQQLLEFGLNPLQI